MSPGSANYRPGSGPGGGGGGGERGGRGETGGGGGRRAFRAGSNLSSTETGYKSPRTGVN